MSLTVPRVRHHGGLALDLTGLALLALLIGWFAIAGRLAGGDPGPLIGIAALSLVALLLGVNAALFVDPALTPAVVIVAAGAIALSSAGDLVASGPLGGPFGYANATGAFFAQAAIAGVVMAVAGRRSALVTVGWTAAAGFAAVVVASGSVAASAVAIALPLLALVVAVSGRRRLAVAAMGGVFAVVVGATTLVGVMYPSGGALQDTVVGAVGERRAVLWHEAVSIMGQEPLTGAGIDSFQRLSPTAVADADARWAHHEFLEVGAETGVVGLALLASVFVWAFVRLWFTGGRVAALGAAAAAAIGIHASIDYVLHFPAIPIAAAALVGSATATRRRSR